MLVAAIMRASSASSFTASTETVVKVEPSLIELGDSTGDPIPIPGTQFTVAIKVYNVTNLYGFDLKFRWNTTYLDYVSHSVHVPRDTYLDGVLWNGVMPLADEVNSSAGTYWIAYSSMAPAPSFNGTGTIFTMTFEVVRQPYDYETDGPTINPIDVFLDFQSTDLAPRTEGPIVPIPHNTEHATVRIWEKRSKLPTKPTLKVEPAEVENMPRFKTFDINIWIIGIDSQYNIQSFNITLNFNSTLIGATNITEGSWPKNYANSTIEILKQINNTAGTATYAVELVPPKNPDPPPAGTLFTVTFHVIYESPTYPPPTCEITLGPTEILDRNVGPISHITENGTYTAYRPPPVAKFTWSPVGNILPRDQAITFDASESYHPSGIKLYAWDFGDDNKTTVETPMITHIYNATGKVTVVLNVTDYGDFWNTTSATLYIIEPQTVTLMSVVNPLTGNNNFTLYTDAASVGSRFNVTLWVYDVENLFAYQVCLYYNSTLLTATRAWLPTWNPKWVFYGKNTIGFPPNLKTDYVQVGDSIVGTFPTFSDAGMLAIVEFEITYTPLAAGLSCSLDINKTDTLLLGPTANEIPSVKANGYYECIYVQPEKASSTISILISPSTINFGGVTTISGAISPPLLSNVTLDYRLEGEAVWKSFAMIQTDMDGKYACAWTPPEVAVYEINATWSGNTNTLPASQTETLTVNKTTPTITINVNPTHTTIGLGVTINGTISPLTIGANANVTIQYRLQGDANWTQLTIVKTNTLGQHTCPWKPSKVGIYELRAIWPGDQNTYESESEHKTVEVEAQPTEIILYVVVGIIVAVIVAVAIYLAKIRKPK
jgi:hypothetical protein